jgi:hypothetical protein
MKKQFKTKLVLNSQTIRRLQDVKGGIPLNYSDGVCRTDECTAGCTVGCRACG